ncbi:hypothetical protein FNH22_10280 [Fulvivirga sp. M361]|uniref:hypothetical protein n=1 Tax=Fulvivirga sp. M361 TaxID=2594266 RepID=UPI001179A3B4|nr:hypothetical protein [Fulvivirga sp. M361]TRX59531.1 hypothetical protein FNH22_10280 [Fulvivirga sp. M361]
MRKPILLILVYLISCAASIAQNGSITLPTTPEAAALHKFVDVPVDLNSGVPKISIDIFDLKFRDFSLPININYHSSGIRVSEISSNVGAGWSLNAGGLISTTARGAADMNGNGYFNSSPKTIYDKYLISGFNEYNGTDPYDDHDALDAIATGQQDGEPDLFYYNYLGKGGNFVFDENLDIRQIPHSSSLIELQNNKFLITDEKGVVYQFVQRETAKVIASSNSNCPKPDWFNGNAFLTYTPTWHLQSIEAPNGDLVTLQYEPVNYSYDFISSQYYSLWKFWDGLQQTGCGGCDNIPLTTCTNQMEVTGVRLVSISASNGHTIAFSYNSTQREDLPGTNALKQIDISNGSELVKSWTLNHSYFGNSEKLKLTTIGENGKPPYIFSYNEATSFPSRLSYSQDHWGYYNGKTNSKLVPGTFIRSEWLSGGNREPDPAYTQLGILTSIQYPTGGSTVFEYEQNDYWFEGDETVKTGKFSPKLALTNTEILYPAITKTFTVLKPGWATINYNIQYDDGSSNNPPPGNICQAKLTLAGQEISSIISSTPMSEIVLLNPGVYQMELLSTADGFSGFYQINWVEEDVVFKQENKLGGGVRVKRIVDKPSVTSEFKIRKFSYNDPSNTMRSSGIFNNNIKYTYDSYTRMICSGSISECKKFNTTSSSVLPVRDIRYQYVTTYYGENGEGGKSLNEFYRFDDLYPYADTWPFTNTTSYNWQDGMLKETRHFKHLNGTYAVIQKDHYEYELNNNRGSYTLEQFPNLNNILAVQVTTLRPYNLIGLIPYSSILDAKVYWHISAWNYLKKHTKEVYSQDDSTQVTTFITDYHYDNPDHIQLTREVTADSKGNTLETNYKYPLDFTAPAVAISKMNEKHIITPVVERTRWITEGPDKSLLSASATNYQYVIDNDIIVPHQSFELTPINTINYTESVDGQVFDNDYRLYKTYTKFDSKGNVLEYTSIDGLHTAFIWGYNNLYPIAKIENSTYAAVSAILGADLGLLNGNSLTEDQIRTKIYSLRSHANMVNARVTTYTYKPLIGVSSVTDPNSIITYYEYDNLGRLRLLRDNDGNIIKRYTYNYKAP